MNSSDLVLRNLPYVSFLGKLIYFFFLMIIPGTPSVYHSPVSSANECCQKLPIDGVRELAIK